jgi:hypothetical protein
VPGRKTRPPGRCSGGSPRSPFLRLRQPHPTPLSGGHRLRLLNYDMAVVGPPFWSTANGCRRPAHPLLGRAGFLRHHWWRFPPVAISVGSRQLPHLGGRFSTPSLLGGGRGELAPLCAAAGGRRDHPWAVLRGRSPLFAGGRHPSTGWRHVLHRWFLYFFTLYCCRRHPPPPAGWRGGVALSPLLAASPRRHPSPLPPAHPTPSQGAGWPAYSANFLRCFFRMPLPVHWSPLTACKTLSRQLANQQWWAKLQLLRYKVT